MRSLVSISCLVLLFSATGEAQTRVWTNADLSQRVPLLERPTVSEETLNGMKDRQFKWSPPPSSYPRPQRSVTVSPVAASRGSVRSGPLYVDGLYVGPSPNGQWTSITHTIPTVRVIGVK